MLLRLSLPPIHELMRHAVIEAVHAREGEALVAGAKLIDLKIDLSASVFHECPPVSHYRIALRDVAILRRLDVAVGDQVAAGASLALFSTEEAEPLAGEPAREARVSIIGIVRQSTPWTVP